MHRETTHARSARTLFLGLAASAVLAACSPHRTPEDDLYATGRGASDLFSFRSFVADEPVELATSGPLAVDIDNFAGPVVVRADRKVEKTFVEVRRVSKHGLGRMDESQDALDDAAWTASLEPRDGGGQTLVVRTDTPNPEKHFHHMEILVVTPSLDTVKVRTAKGDVTIIENQGAVDVETSKGDVRMMTPWAMINPVTIVTSDGSIDYRVRGESKGLFDCETHGGEVRQRCEFGRWIALDPENDHDRFLATLNGGTNPVVLRTTNDNIRVAVVANPTAVGFNIVDP